MCAQAVRHSIGGRHSQAAPTVPGDTSFGDLAAQIWTTIMPCNPRRRHDLLTMVNIPPAAGKSAGDPHSAKLSSLIERNWFARESYFIRKLADDRLRGQGLDTRESHELAKRAERAWAEADSNLKAHMKAP